MNEIPEFSTLSELLEFAGANTAYSVPELGIASIQQFGFTGINELAHSNIPVYDRRTYIAMRDAVLAMFVEKDGEWRDLNELDSVSDGDIIVIKRRPLEHLDTVLAYSDDIEFHDGDLWKRVFL